MKKIKSILLVAIALVLFGGVTNVKAEGKVKVYVFEAGGCPWCEKEKEYLKGLDSYNKKFEIVEKKLYVDHVDWNPAKDYPVGKAVAEAFQSVGFENAKYTGTPFVVISDIYASTAYNTSLEEIINEAYEKGDKDVVGCYASDGENCLEGADPSIKVDWSIVTEEEESSDGVETITTIILLLIIGGIVALVAYNEKVKANNTEEEKEETPVVKEAKKEITKKVTEKKEKAPVKKAAKKTSSKTSKKSNKK